MAIQQMFLGAGGGGKAYTEATGGTITTSGDWKIHTFTSTASTHTFTVTKVGETNTIEYLIIAGGGGGGNGYVYGGGGGGAGGYRSSVVGESSGGGASAETAPVITASDYTITVGPGGGANQYGQDSKIHGNLDGTVKDIISEKGGYGAGGTSYQAGGNGGSGGGAMGWSGNKPPAGAGTAGQGYAGGGTHQNYSFGGGGGGAGGAGGSGGNGWAGARGAGLSSSISGTAVTYAQGGNASTYSSQYVQAAVAGGANTGTGGGGATIWPYSAWGSAAAGGSGIVIIRYKYQN